MAVSFGGIYAFSGSEDGELYFWDIANRKKLYSIKGHSGRINAVAIFPNGKRAISASKDKDLKLWDLENGELIATFTAEAYILSVAITLDGQKIIAGDQNGHVHILRIEG